MNKTESPVGLFYMLLEDSRGMRHARDYVLCELEESIGREQGWDYWRSSYLFKAYEAVAKFIRP